MLNGNKVLLRPIEEKDIEKFYFWRNDIKIKELALMHPFPVTSENEKDWYQKIASAQNNDLIFFSVVDKINNQLIGYAKLFNINFLTGVCYFGIIIGEESIRGKGYGKDTTELIINYAFKTLNLRKIILEVADYNEKAIKLYEKLGFELEGKLKKNVYADGKFYDLLIMSLFCDDHFRK